MEQETSKAISELDVKIKKLKTDLKNHIYDDQEEISRINSKLNKQEKLINEIAKKLDLGDSI
jgi:AAA+ superfamily predicted ATPase